ncbi:MAG: hypothetical protein CMJ49_05685 [Planctomycetaceae bacterium]|nr:hypothetical protein [Planctomycetaceae bacterium]
MASLSQLQVGQSARVDAIAGDTTLGQRLMALGLLPGTQLSVIRVAPLGDPITIETHGGQLSLRRADAQHVTVTVDPAQ